VLRFCDDEALLIDRRSRTIYRLNASAAFLWGLITSGLPAAQAAAELAAAADLPFSEARDHVERLLAQWRDAGLLDDFDASGAPVARGLRERIVPDASFGPKPGAVTRMYRLLRSTIAVHFAEAAWADLADEALGLAKSDDKPADADETFAVIRAGGGLAVHTGREVLTCPGPATLAPLLEARMVYAALVRDAAHGVVHAAAITFGSGTVLLSAESGSGKSTLCAALLAAGGALVADDTVVLTAGGGVEGLPTAVSVKEGSWPVLRGLWPELDRAAIHVREDEKRVRYIRPPRLVTPGEELAVSALLFPLYHPGSAAVLRQLSAKDAIGRLLPALFSPTDELDVELVDRAIALVSRVPCYSLTFDRLDEAVAVIREISATC
jgi:Coenzyme PQQ synthesis protein D (PqqD)